MLVIVIVIIVTGVLSVVFNFMILLTVLRRRREASALELYIINMAVIDLCPTVLAYPATTTAAFSHRWLLGSFGNLLQAAQFTALLNLITMSKAFPVTVQDQFTCFCIINIWLIFIGTCCWLLLCLITLLLDDTIGGLSMDETKMYNLLKLISA